MKNKYLFWATMHFLLSRQIEYRKPLLIKRFFPTIKIKPIKAGPKIQIVHCQLIFWTAQMAHSGRSENLDGLEPQDDTLGHSVVNPIDAVAPPRRLRTATEPSRLRRRLCAERPAAALLAARAAGLGCGRNWKNSSYKKTVRRNVKIQRTIKKNRGRRKHLLRQRQKRLDKARERREAAFQQESEKSGSDSDSPIFEQKLFKPEDAHPVAAESKKPDKQAANPVDEALQLPAPDVGDVEAVTDFPRGIKRKADLGEDKEPPAKLPRSNWGFCTIMWGGFEGITIKLKFHFNPVFLIYKNSYK